MHFAFIASVLVQLALAVHAYNHGRTRPWVWLILFFPVVGSLLYAAIFLMPKLKANRAPAPLSLRRVSRGPFAKTGDRPDNAIEVGSLGEIAGSRSSAARTAPSAASRSSSTTERATPSRGASSRSWSRAARPATRRRCATSSSARSRSRRGHGRGQRHRARRALVRSRPSTTDG